MDVQEERRNVDPSSSVADLQSVSSLNDLKESSDQNKNKSLTMKILESSERKMQLLRRLISPEEYNSLVSRLFSESPDEVYQENTKSVQSLSTPDSLTSLSTSSDDNKQAPIATDTIEHPERSKLLRDSLALKTRAYEFFFDCSPSGSVAGQEGEIAVELRRAYQLIHSSESQAQVLRDDCSSSWLERLWNLLDYLGLPSLFRQSETATAATTTSGFQGEQESEELTYSLERRKSSVYFSARNLLVMRDRLKSDNQLLKLMEQREQEVGAMESWQRFEEDERWPGDARRKPTTIKFDPSNHWQQIGLQKCKSQLEAHRSDLLYLSKGAQFRTSALAHSLMQSGSPWIEMIVQRVSLAPRRPFAKVYTDKSNGLFSRALRFRISSIKIRNLNLESEEEKLAHKLLEQYNELKLLEKSAAKLAANLLVKPAFASGASSCKSSDESAQRSYRQLKLRLERAAELTKQVSRARMELADLSKGLSDVREQQGFASTCVLLLQVHLEQESLQLLERHLQRIQPLIDELGLANELQALKVALAEAEKGTSFELKLQEAILSDEAGLEKAELERRRLLRAWLASFECRLRASSSELGIRHESRQKLEPTGDSLVAELAMNQMEFVIPATGGRAPEQKLELTILQRGPLLPVLVEHCWRLSPVAWRATTLSTVQTESRALKLQFLDGTAELRLRLESEPLPVHDARSELVHTDFLYAKFFRSTGGLPEQPSLLSSRDKLSRLLNRVEHAALLEALGAGAVDGATHFRLDPLHDKPPGALERPASARHCLLVWRWCNRLLNSRQQVYLSEQENIKNYGLQVEHFRSQLRSISRPGAQATDSELLAAADGLAWLGARRERAIGRLEQLEQLLVDTREQRPSQPAGCHAHSVACTPPTAAAPLLLEPRLSLDLSGLASLLGRLSATRQLIPRPRRRRPLMARAGRGAPTSRLRPGRAGSESRSTGAPAPQQLVVTVRQATGVPLRVAAAPAGPHWARSRSATPTLMASGARNSPAAPQLEPATSYVELVFQRLQLASSLAQGTSPAWNETIFFPLADAGASLADEFLQVNLYDYRLADGGGGLAPAPPDERGVAAALTPQKLVASAQLVERHLLGSLRVPLRALASLGGRIEGSFALEQPALLESYQFEPEVASLAPGQELLLHQEPRTCLSLFVILDPPPPPPPPASAHILWPAERREDWRAPAAGSREPEKLADYARLWEGALSQPGTGTRRPAGGRRAAGERRFVRALALLSDGQVCLICRLLAPMSAPPQLLAGVAPDARMQALARFVWLMSPLKHGHLSRKLAAGLWFDSRELLERQLGGAEEKAALLCNYFLGLGKCSALLLADSLHEGSTVQVLVWDEPTAGGGAAPASIESQLEQQAAELFESMSRERRPSKQPPLGEGSGAGLDPERFRARIGALARSCKPQIWDPSSGTCYESLERSPLVSVGAVVTMENVYANVQPAGTPMNETNFRLAARHSWFPLLERAGGGGGGGGAPGEARRRLLPANTWVGTRAQLEQARRALAGQPRRLAACFEPEAVRYSAAWRAAECARLSQALEREIKAQLLRWRPKRPTYFNRTLGRLAQEKLAGFEARLLAASPRSVAWQAELAALVRDEALLSLQGRLPFAAEPSPRRQLVSCPIQVPFAGARELVELVHASGLHNADLVLGPARPPGGQPAGLQTQFLVACHTHCYAGGVLAVWLYAAAIVGPHAVASSLAVAG